MKIVEVKNINSYKINTLIFYFFIYSFIGWCMEVTYFFARKGYFVNRGFLIGPFCCIYGCGALLIIVFLKRFKHNPFMLFVSAAAVTTILEYFTGYLMEKVFNNKWWDYSDQPMNISGYICLKNTLYWGAAAVIVLYFIHPFVRFAAYYLLKISKPVFLYSIIIYFISDFTLSAILASNAGAVNQNLNALIQEVKNFIHNIHDVAFKGLSNIRSEILSIKL